MPITDELNRLVLNYINPLLSLDKDEFALRLRFASSPRKFANEFDVKIPRIDESSMIGTRKTSPKKVDDYTQAMTKTVTHLLINVKANGNATLLGCKPTTGRQPPVEVTREGNDLSFIIPYNEETNDLAWNVVGSISDILSDIENDINEMLPRIRQDMERRIQAKIDEIARDKAIAASITFPIKNS